ncbi:hypothetical protein NLJ89_g3745 [Agrocybe chaxingu]|uniref:Uncharacterized protein n=1 Tax=Agrocybe chaxingu TaxID=84603 RepID=A0A9W8K483_9AGAR|nr:hypothetical protein NLJ89_g3745 [Agrocybe chaxingu]
MPAIPGTSIIIPVDSTMGACLIGSFFSCILYGLTLLQTYHYCCRYWGKDKLYIYVLVATVTVLDTFGIILNIKGLWYYLIDNYGNVLSILFIDWTLAILIIVTALTSILVQAFYSYRLWMISGKKMVALPIVIMLLGFVALALCIVYMVLMLRNGAILYIPTVTIPPVPPNFRPLA